MPEWLSAASYWQPAHLVTSAWLEHAPFAFWLVDELRPRSIVELGTHWGFSFFVFAEAVRRLGLDSQLHAVDTWQGDDQAGYYGEEVYDAVRSIAERDYPGYAHLLRGYFSEARPRIENGSVDLLHIDGRHGYDDVRTDYEEWVSTVRDGGVILFHDIAEREGGFGVWQLWEEEASRHPSFAFTHGHGLGVLGIGSTKSSRLRSLFKADAATASQARAKYQQLGADIARLAALATLPAEVDSLHAVVDSLQELAESRAGEIVSLRNDVASLTNDAASLADEVGRLNTQLRSRELILEATHASVSWRVTRPFRRLHALIRRNPVNRAATPR